MEELKFFFNTFFRTDIKVGIERYKRQRWVAFLFFFPIALVLLWIFSDAFGYPDYYYDLSEKQQIKFELSHQLKYQSMFFFMMLCTNLLTISNEIHRANMLNKNWKKKVAILLLFYFIYILFEITFYYLSKPEFMQPGIFILIFANFIFSANAYATSDEEKLGKVK
ncbi:hypothetical protein ACMGE9_10840 [Macrococcus sp. EM39E]|uniref:hypothetical protein n=1 Tax=Macrococcus animalis TaxID=3395467 RepID=UPI0039BDC0B5